MRKHPDIGYQMIQTIPFLRHAGADRALATRSAWTARGYPRNLRGEEIHIGARIFAVADTLDAMTSRPAVPQGHHVRERDRGDQRCAGTQFDPEVVRAFLDIGE